MLYLRSVAESSNWGHILRSAFDRFLVQDLEVSWFSLSSNAVVAIAIAVAVAVAAVAVVLRLRVDTFDTTGVCL